jgi:hypothetical protein
MNKQERSEILNESDFIITEALELVFNLLKEMF